MIKRLIQCVAALFVIALLFTSFSLSIHNIVKLKDLRDTVIPPSTFDEIQHADIIDAFEMIEKNENFVNQFGQMHVITGYNENIDSVLQFIEENLPIYRISLITIDGRFFFDTTYTQDLHNGIQVYTDINLLEASINGSPDELTELAIENHESRPEISAAIRYNDLRTATRQSATTRKNSFYFAKRYGHVVFRLIKEE